jgi:hypothetical protein
MAADRPQRRDDVSIRTMADEVIVLDRANQQVHQLNASAGFVWQRCDGQHTVESIADELCGAFEVTAETAREAVRTALHRFAELGLLQREPA